MRRPDADVVIAGGGLAAQRCAETLRRAGFEGRIVVLCEEPLPPYDRPPLSKAVLAGERDPRELALRPPRWYEEHEVELLLGTAATHLDVASHTVGLRSVVDAASHTVGLRSVADGAGLAPGAATLRYRHLVIATGSRPRRLAGLEPGGAIHELRTAADALALRAHLDEQDGPLVVLGAGLVGMEVASAARARGHEVTLVEAAPTPLGRALPPSLGAWLACVHREHGVEVRLATAVEGAVARTDGVMLTLSDGAVLEAATVLVAAGTLPATEWLGEGGSAASTDEAGRTRWPDVYAAGDAACFPDPHLGVRVPSQHWEAAVRQGAAVARAIAGLAPVQLPPPMFWSDQHGRRIQLVGHAPAGCAIALDGEPAGGEPFVAWLIHGGAPAGALLVDRPDILPRARQWVASALTDAVPHEAAPSARESTHGEGLAHAA